MIMLRRQYLAARMFKLITYIKYIYTMDLKFVTSYWFRIDF